MTRPARGPGNDPRYWEMWRAGFTQEQIARECGVTQQAVSYWLMAEHGDEMHPRTRTCLECPTEFETAPVERRPRRYCSRTCDKRAYFRRKALPTQ